MVTSRLRRPATCAACGSPLGGETLEAHGQRFHSSLCMHKYEKDTRRGERSKKNTGGGGCGGCH